jgi:DnaJ-class molecular chaperone
VTVQVETPSDMTEEQRELLRQVAAAFGVRVHEPGRGFLGRIKDALG